MNDWLHCNVCVRLPNSNDAVAFFLTSCGHIICQKCLEKRSVDSCQICRKDARVLEINRSLHPDHQIYFRNAKDLLETYVKKLNSVLDFQAHHRSRLAKARQDQQKKAAKFIMSAQVELKRREESENYVLFKLIQALEEKDNLVEEVKKLRHHTQKLEALIAEQATVGRRPTPTSSRASGSKRITVFYSEFTPNNSVSTGTQTIILSIGSHGSSHRDRNDHMPFSVVATSTPLSDCLNTHASSTRSSSSKRLVERFADGAVEPSPIFCDPMLTTPVMLGLRKNVNSCTTGNYLKNGDTFPSRFEFN